MLTGAVVQTTVAPHPATASTLVTTWSPGHPDDRPLFHDPVLRLCTVQSPMLSDVAGSDSFSEVPHPDCSCDCHLLRQCECCLHVHHQRTKHIEIDIHFVLEKVALGQVHALHVPSSHQYADIMTKGLPTQLFTDFRSSICVQKPTAATASGYRYV
jgi:hypothetical protein